MSEGIVVDASAMVALLEGEPEAARIKAALRAARPRVMGAFSALECQIVARSRRGLPGAILVEGLLRRLEVTIQPLDVDQVELAATAWERFGKGRHPAALNIGDCCTYALARRLGSKLLCKGDDFPLTDLELVEY